MSQSRVEGTWDAESSIANANTALDKILDAAADIAGSVTTIHVDAEAWIRATDGSTGKYNYKLGIVASSNAVATLKTNLDSLWLEYEDMCTGSAKYSTISTVDGRAIVTVDY